MNLLPRVRMYTRLGGQSSRRLISAESSKLLRPLFLTWPWGRVILSFWERVSTHHRWIASI